MSPTRPNSSSSRSRTAPRSSIGKRGEQLQQAIERVVDVAAGEIEVRDHELRVDVGGAGGGGGAGLLQIGALHAVEQTHLSETGSGVGIPRVLREGLLVRGDRARVVARLDRVERLGVQRRQRQAPRARLARRQWPRRDLDGAGHAVLRGQLQQLREDLANLLLGNGAGEQRNRLAADERDDHGDRLRAERLGELGVRIDVDPCEHEASAGFAARASRGPE